MNPVSIIEKKKRGRRLSREEIGWMVRGYLSGLVEDYHISALLMAVYFQGMDDEETTHLTEAMLAAGTRLDLSKVPPPRVDKHSTGGVGDKVSLALAPLAASCGLKVPMLSGRSLAHTGGTIDKLESIPSFRSLLSPDEMVRMLRKVGCFVSGQTESIAPADRKIYALRDATSTVDCIPLIVSSILSKKLAEGIDALVMDVKCGSGAFMQSLAAAKSLSAALKKTGERLGLKVRVLITSMDEPLGQAVGNALEVIEAFRLLEGKGPGDLWEVTRELTAEMLLSSGAQESRKAALAAAETAVASGEALKTFKRWIQNQGGELDFSEVHLGLQLAPVREDVIPGDSGYIQGIDAREVGLAVQDLGGGRRSVGGDVDRSVGLYFFKKVGEVADSGEAVFRVYAREEDTLHRAKARVLSAIKFGRKAVKPTPRLLSRI